MAVDHVYAHQCQLSNGVIYNFSTFLKCESLSNLSYDGNRIKWNGNSKLLKQVTAEILNLTGAWSSPGGKAKKFTCSNCDLAFTWYPGKQNSLCFQGSGGCLLRDFVANYCNLRQDKSKAESPLVFPRSERIIQ